ncbi:conserved hypothetical protein, partial [Trichinella spiralis]|uniref:hypothetical protein n=1 Tax=Trichinella spiralis TaxID=6334 RepID=UPI0001EFEDF0
MSFQRKYGKRRKKLRCGKKKGVNCALRDFFRKLLLIGPSSNACYGSEKKKKRKKKKEEESKGRLMNFDKLPLSYAKCMKLNERSRSRRRRRSKSSSHSRHRRSTEDRRRRRSRSRKRTSRSRSSRSTTSTRRYYSSRHRRSRSELNHAALPDTANCKMDSECDAASKRNNKKKSIL